MTLPLIFPPSSLPKFSAGGHGIRLGSDYAGVPRGRGHTRKRPKSSGAPRIVSVAWQLTYAQATALEFWIEHSLEVGTLSFTAEVANQGPGRLYWSAKWLRLPRYSPIATPRGPEWTVTGHLILSGEGEAVLPTTGALAGEITFPRLGSATLVLPETPLAGEIVVARIAITPLAGEVYFRRTSTITPLSGEITFARTGSGTIGSGSSGSGSGTIDVGEEDGSPLQAVDALLFPANTVTYDSNGAAVYTPAPIVIQAGAPSNPYVGLGWLDTDIGVLFWYVYDGNSFQWVEL